MTYITPPALCLASASKARADLLRQLGVEFRVDSMDIDEQRLPNEPVGRYVTRLALAKAQAGFELSDRQLPTLGADTVIHLDGRIIGKPADRSAATQILNELSGRTHEVVTGAGIVTCSGSRVVEVSTQVTFTTLTAADIERYWLSGEPVGKAGAYAIQGFGAAFVSHIDGSYSNVVGLPLFEVSDLLLFAELDLVRTTAAID